MSQVETTLLPEPIRSAHSAAASALVDLSLRQVVFSPRQLTFYFDDAEREDLGNYWQGEWVDATDRRITPTEGEPEHVTAAPRVALSAAWRTLVSDRAALIVDLTPTVLVVRIVGGQAWRMVWRLS